jgi:hypothetical protein
MTPEEMNLDMLVAELDRENRLLRARNQRLDREAEQRKSWVGLTDDEIKKTYFGCRADFVDYARAIEAKLREKNQ